MVIDEYVRARSGFPDPVQHQLDVIRAILVNMDRKIISRLSSVCTPVTCPKMIASDEWHFLCAPHNDKPRDCCAIDYMKHTVDSCTSTLLVAVQSAASLPKQFNSIMRRIFRIFGHLFFHHSAFFQQDQIILTECLRIYLFLKECGLWKPDMAIIPEPTLDKLLEEKTGQISTARHYIKPAGTIVDLRAVTMQLSEDATETSSTNSDSTVIMS